jgi:hypothetical protein
MTDVYTLSTSYVHIAAEDTLHRDWPQDKLHEAAREIMGNPKGLVPQARKALKGSLDRADAAPAGREASDRAIGNIGSRMLQGMFYGGVRTS